MRTVKIAPTALCQFVKLCGPVSNAECIKCARIRCWFSSQKVRIRVNRSDSPTRKEARAHFQPPRDALFTHPSLPAYRCHLAVVLQAGCISTVLFSSYSVRPTSCLRLRLSAGSVTGSDEIRYQLSPCAIF